MAKKRKGNKKRNKRKNVGKNTTTQPVLTQSTANPAKEIKTSHKTVETTSKKHLDEISDVRYSLILFGAILAVFGILYFVLQNQSVSAAIYGIIKL